MPGVRHAVLGGTFDHFHLGHAALLARAFHVGRDVSIGVTTDAFLAAHPKPLRNRIQPYATRRRGVLRWIHRHYPARSVRVVPLANPFGRSTELGVDVLVVSADTLAGGRAVNRERRRLGRPPIPIEIVPVVLADDLEPVSSRRIRAGIIDRRGRRTAPLRIGLASRPPSDAAVVAQAIRTAFPTGTLIVRRPGRVRPLGSARAEATALARRALVRTDLAVAVVRRPRGGWLALERSRNVELAPRAVPTDGGDRGLRRSIAEMLRPDGSGRQVL